LSKEKRQSLRSNELKPQAIQHNAQPCSPARKVYSKADKYCLVSEKVNF